MTSTARPNKKLQRLLSKVQQLEIASLTNGYIAMAREEFDEVTIGDVDVQFDLRGSTAGQYHAGQSLIRYNSAIAYHNYDQFKKRTIPHEAAHHVVSELFPGRSQFVKPHGIEWQSVMALFGVDDCQRCHNYDLTGIRVKRQKRVEYHCHCNVHLISMTIHNRIQRGAVYKCRSCHENLTQQSVSHC